MSNFQADMERANALLQQAAMASDKLLATAGKSVDRHKLQFLLEDAADKIERAAAELNLVCEKHYPAAAPAGAERRTAHPPFSGGEVEVTEYG